METKYCFKCKTNTSTDLFFKNRSQKDGLANWCKICHTGIKGNVKIPHNYKLPPIEVSNEIWKIVIIDNIKTEYHISNYGRLRHPNGKIFKVRVPESNEYISACVKANNNYIATRMHRLVATAFISNPENKPQVNHKNGIKFDNRSDNLEWNTAKENVIHSFDIGLTIRPKAEESHLWDKGRKIIHEGKIYNSVAQASRETGIPRTTINAELHKYRPNKYNFKFV